MNYSDEQQKRTGIDYDLRTCLEYNPQPFNLLDIERVLAVWEGERDEDDWRWIIKLTAEAGKKHGGRFVFLQGGCDYTGWDCQSWAKVSFAKTSLKAAEFAKTGPSGATYREAVGGMGLGRMITALSGEYMKNAPDVYTKLVEQLKSAKSKTWRERKDEEMLNEESN